VSEFRLWPAPCFTICKSIFNRSTIQNFRFCAEEIIAKTCTDMEPTVLTCYDNDIQKKLFLYRRQRVKNISKCSSAG
jgi:hypothetical protein